MLVLFKFFLWILLLNPCFLFHRIVPQVSPCIRHFENSHALLWNPRPLKKVICLSIFQKLFLLLISCYAIFTWIWTYKSHDLTDHQLIISSYLPAITFMGRAKQTSVTRVWISVGFAFWLSLLDMPTNWGSNSSGKDWTLTLQSYLISSLELFDEYWIQRLPNQDYQSPLCVQSFGFQSQS